MEKDDRKYMNIAINEAKKAFIKDEIPVGAIVVLNNKIIGRGFNKKNSTNLVINHAEIIAIEKANKKINNWRLNNAILYTTLEPCQMCEEVIRESRISLVVYGAKRKEIISKKEYTNKLQIDDDYLKKKCEKLLDLKFSEIREKEKSGKKVSRETKIK